MSSKSKSADVAALADLADKPKAQKKPAAAAAPSAKKAPKTKKRPLPEDDSAESSSEDDSDMEEDEAPRRATKPVRVTEAREELSDASDDESFPDRPTKKYKNDFEVFRTHHGEHVKNYAVAKFVATGGQVSDRKGKNDEGLQRQDIIDRKTAEITAKIAQIKAENPELIKTLEAAYKDSRIKYEESNSVYTERVKEYDAKYPKAAKILRMKVASNRSHKNVVQQANIDSWVKSSHVHEITQDLNSALDRENQLHAARSKKITEEHIKIFLEATSALVKSGGKPPKRQKVDQKLLTDAPANTA